jgi:hypothetical protein
MIRIPALDLILEQDTLNRISQRWIPETQLLRSLRLEILPQLIRIFIEGQLPLVGDREVSADLSTELRGDELWLRLERTSVPLVPKAALVSLIASQAKQEALRAEGACLVLSLDLLFLKYEIQTKVSSLSVDRGQVRLLCLAE